MILNDRSKKKAKRLFTKILNIGVDFKLQEKVTKKRLAGKDIRKILVDLPEKGIDAEQVLNEFVRDVLPFCTNFTKRDLNVIVPYPLSEKNYNDMMDHLKYLDTAIHVFTLAPQLEKVMTNRGTRELDDWERGRIEHHYAIGIPNPTFGEIIDNTDQTPEETASLILSKVKSQNT